MLSSSSGPTSELRIDLSASQLDRPFYTTLEEICGRIIFAPQSPIPVDDVVVDFLGIVDTWVDPLSPGALRKRISSVVGLTFESLSMF